MITLDDLHSARTLLEGITVRTPLTEFDLRVPHFSRPLREVGTLASNEARLFLKPENQQPIGAFKLRGAYNKIASLSEPERKRGVISYSSGNHAQGVAYAARALGVKAVIVMPNNAPAIKREATAALGADIVLVGPGSTERQLKAEELAAQHGYIVVPPYNDRKNHRWPRHDRTRDSGRHARSRNRPLARRRRGSHQRPSRSDQIDKAIGERLRCRTGARG